MGSQTSKVRTRTQFNDQEIGGSHKSIWGAHFKQRSTSRKKCHRYFFPNSEIFHSQIRAAKQIVDKIRTMVKKSLKISHTRYLKFPPSQSFICMLYSLDSLVCVSRWVEQAPSFARRPEASHATSSPLPPPAVPRQAPSPVGICLS